jgi:hypothetical protein
MFKIGVPQSLIQKHRVRLRKRNKSYAKALEGRVSRFLEAAGMGFDRSAATADGTCIPTRQDFLVPHAELDDA